MAFCAAMDIAFLRLRHYNKKPGEITGMDNLFFTLT